MKTRLILVRHGRARHHELGVSAGFEGDQGLTDEGREQVRRCGERLAQWPGLRGTPVYSSTLGRARESGEIIADAIGAGPVVEHCGLCSYHVLPEHDGRPHSDAWATARRGGGVALYRPEHDGGDTFAALVLRAAAAYHEIADAHHGQTVVVATHNETVQASLVALGDLGFRHRMQTSVACGSITEWATDADTTAGGPADGWVFHDWNLVRWNDTGHLEE